MPWRSRSSFFAFDRRGDENRSSRALVSERLVQYPRQSVAELTSPAAGEIDKANHGRAEQLGIDSVKIMLVACKDRGKRFAMIGRSAAGNTRPNRRQFGIGCVDPQRHLAAVQNRVVGATERRELIAGHGRKRGRTPTADNARQIETELVELVERGFHAPSDDLHGAGQAGGRSRKQREPIGLDARARAKSCCKASGGNSVASNTPTAIVGRSRWPIRSNRGSLPAAARIGPEPMAK